MSDVVSESKTCDWCGAGEKDHQRPWLHLYLETPTRCVADWTFCSAPCLVAWLPSKRSPQHPIHTLGPLFLEKAR